MDPLDARFRRFVRPIRPNHNRKRRWGSGDKSLQRLVGQLLAARDRAGLTQQEVARRMGTTKSAISRLESGRDHRPNLTTIENYALVVGCRVEITLQPFP